MVISGYGHPGCCFYVYCFIWLILVNLTIPIKKYLTLVNFSFIWCFSNSSNYFNATVSNAPSTRLRGMKQDIQDTKLNLHNL